jgi:hypothetical protein
MMVFKKIGVLAAAGFLGMSAQVMAADMPSRVTKPSPPVAASAACKETSGLPTDIFGFTTGSDVNDLGALSGALEYNGNYGTRFGRLTGHLLKGQVSYSPFSCFEIGPTIQGQTVNAGLTTFGLDSRQFGGTVEMKYKLTGRATHGIGITAVQVRLCRCVRQSVQPVRRGLFKPRPGPHRLRADQGQAVRRDQHRTRRCLG